MNSFSFKIDCLDVDEINTVKGGGVKTTTTTTTTMTTDDGHTTVSTMHNFWGTDFFTI